MNRRLTLTMALTAIALIAMPAFAQAATYTCDSCADCENYLSNSSSNDIIEMTQSITSPGGLGGEDCIRFGGFSGDNKTFDCKGYTITTVSGGVGIFLDTSSTATNTTIKNCVIPLPSVRGIRIIEGSGGNFTIDNVTIASTSIGILWSGTIHGGRITNSHISGGTAAVQLDSIYNGDAFSSPCADITDSYLNSSGTALDMLSCSEANYSGNIFEGGIGVTLGCESCIEGAPGFFACDYFSVDNIFYNNIFNTTTHVTKSSCYNSYEYDNDWNVTLQAGSNIFDPNNLYVGGNYWSFPNGTGFSELCNDTNDDGFCDDDYNVIASFYDYEPMSSYINITIPDCDSCSNCNILLQNATGDSVINLTTNINSTVNCILMNTSGKTLDCQGYSINSTGTTYDNSAVFMDADNLVLKNCEVIGGGANIWIDTDSDNLQLINNTMHDNLGTGLACVRYKSQHNNGLVEYNEIYNCNDEAINRDGVGSVLNVTFRYNTIHDSDGIAMDGSIYYNNTIYDNTRSLDFSLGVDDAEVYDNDVYDNTYGLYLTGDCADNDIHNNTFNNTNNFYASGVTGSGNTMSYNLWSDYNGWDNTGDGVGNTDTPYVVVSGVFEDNTPLTSQLDADSPNMFINDPQSQTYQPDSPGVTQIDIDVELTANDSISGLDTCLYSVDGGSNQTYSAPFTTTITSEGQHTLDFYCNDTAENWGFDSVSFTLAKLTAVEGFPILAVIPLVLVAATILTILGSIMTSGEFNMKLIVTGAIIILLSVIFAGVIFAV